MSPCDPLSEADALGDALGLTPEQAQLWRRETTIIAQLADPFLQAGEHNRFMLLYNALQGVIRALTQHAWASAFSAAEDARLDAYRLGRVDQLKEDCKTIGCRVPDWAIELEAEIAERAQIRLDAAKRRRLEVLDVFARERPH